MAVQRLPCGHILHRAPTEITLIFCTEFYYHANISTNGNTRSLEKFLYENLYHPEFVRFDLYRKIMRHLLDATITWFDQSACRRGEFLCAGTRVRLYPNIKKILYFISSRAFWAYTILRVKSESLHWCGKSTRTEVHVPNLNTFRFFFKYLALLNLVC